MKRRKPIAFPPPLPSLPLFPPRQLSGHTPHPALLPFSLTVSHTRVLFCSSSSRVSSSSPRVRRPSLSAARAAPRARAAQATWHNFRNIHANFTRVCDDECLQMQLPFDVPSLADLCRRGSIAQNYAKCATLTGGGGGGGG